MNRFKKSLLKTTCLVGVIGTGLADRVWEFGGPEWRTVEYNDSRALDGGLGRMNTPGTPTLFKYRFGESESHKTLVAGNDYLIGSPLSEAGRILTRRALNEIEMNSNVQFIEVKDPKERVDLEYYNFIASADMVRGNTIVQGQMRYGYPSYVTAKEEDPLERSDKPDSFSCPPPDRSVQVDSKNIFSAVHQQVCREHDAVTQKRILHETLHALGAQDIDGPKADPFTIITTYTSAAPAINDALKTVMSYEDNAWLESIRAQVKLEPEKAPTVALGDVDKEWLKRHYPRNTAEKITLPEKTEEVAKRLFHKARSDLKR